MAEVEVGSQAPDFTLPANGPEKVTLSDFRGKKNVMVSFYPQDFTGSETGG